MEAIGLASSIIAIIEILLKSTQELSAFIDNVRSAPKEIGFLKDETSSFTNILTCFHLIADDAMNWDEEGKKTRQELIRSVRQECNVVSKELNALVERFRAIDPVHNSPARVFWTRVVWTFKKPNSDLVGQYLITAKLSVTCATNFFQLQQERPHGNARIM